MGNVAATKNGTLLHPEARAEILRRIEALTPRSERRWDRMTPHQMVCHLSDACRAALGVEIPRLVVVLQAQDSAARGRLSGHEAGQARVEENGRRPIPREWNDAGRCLAAGEKSPHRPRDLFDKSAASGDWDLCGVRQITGRRSCSGATASIEEASWSWSPIALSSCTTSGQSICRAARRSSCWPRRPAVLASRRAGRFDATAGRGCTITRSRVSSTTASSARCGGSRRGAAVRHGRDVGPPVSRPSVRRRRFCAQTHSRKGSLSAQAARSRGGRAIVVPPGDAGYDAEPGSPPGDLTLAACGLALASRPAADAVAELFTHPGPARPRAVALWARPGSGLGTAIDALARTARLHGYVPVSSRFVASSVLELLAGRSLLVIDRVGASRGWRGLVDITLRLPGPHVLLLAGSEEIAHVHGLPLAPVAASALVEAIRPRDVPAAVRRRVEAAARRSRGLPGTFVSLLWGEDVRRQSPVSGFTSRDARPHRATIVRTGAIGRTGRVAERSPAYGVDSPVAPDGAWAAPRELAGLRRRLQDATRQLDAGRHAPGDRLLRGVIGGLARRHDWPHALGGAIALAGSLLKRGRPQDARAVLADAHGYATRTGQDAGVIDVAILTGVAWTDLARLDEAEGVLQAALAASRSSDMPARLERARLALARCLFWRGRYAEAAALLASMDRAAEVTATRVAVDRGVIPHRGWPARPGRRGRERDRGARHRRTDGRPCASGAGGVHGGVRAPRDWGPCGRRP